MGLSSSVIEFLKVQQVQIFFFSVKSTKTLNWKLIGSSKQDRQKIWLLKKHKQINKNKKVMFHFQKLTLRHHAVFHF